MPRAGRAEIGALLERVADGVAARCVGRERDERREGFHVGEPSGEAVGVDDAPDRGADDHGRRQESEVATYLPPPSEIITARRRSAPPHRGT